MAISSQPENIQPPNDLPPITNITAFKKTFRPAIIAAKIKLAQIGRNPDEYHAHISDRNINIKNQRVIVVNCVHKDEFKPEFKHKITLGDACGNCFEMEYHIKSRKIINVYMVE